MSTSYNHGYGPGQLLSKVLKRVSRSFYLSLRVLPSPIREPVGLAYLLARTADTIADTTALPSADRLERLIDFRGQVRGEKAPKPITNLTKANGDEHLLLWAVPETLALLEASAWEDQERIRSVVTTLTEGMELDLTTFPPEGSGQVGALENRADLEHYTYLIAGCVGEFWTATTIAHDRALRDWDQKTNNASGIAYGKGLQLTNILRDVPRDLRIGRCYLPANELRECQLTATDLLNQDSAGRAWPVVDSLIRVTLDHYSLAKSYILSIPRRAVRLRLAALWPLLIGLPTLQALAANELWLDPSRRIKVSRSYVYRLIALSLLLVRSDSALSWWVGGARKGVERALDTRAH